MKFVNRKNILLVLLVIWLVLWCNFIMRDLFKKRRFHDYRALLKRNATGKASYTYGDHFYQFLELAKKNMHGNSTYDFIGVKDLSTASRRAIYYLYPNLKTKNPEYILVYNVPGYRKDGYILDTKLDDARFILKRK